MRKKLLLKAACRHQKGSLACIALLLFLVALSGFAALALLISGEQTVSAEMDRLGFGDLTVWVNAHEDTLRTELLEQPDVGNVTVQPLIFAGYQANGTYSDNEGQLIVYDSSVPYRFIGEDGTAFSVTDVQPGQVFVSPAMLSGFGLHVGDTITFELTRSNDLYSLTVAGYFEDAFMGSSMIDMKSFLISARDREVILSVTSASPEYDQLARTGAMMHITQKEDSTVSASAFSRKLNTETSISADTAFTYSKASIQRFMLLLQNILTGFMVTFSGVLLAISAIVMSHSISAAIHQNRKDLAVMKTMGVPSGTIRSLYFILYGGCAVLALLLGAIPAYALARLLAKKMLTSTGLLVQVHFPVGWVLLIFIVVVSLLILLLIRCTARIMNIAPMQTLSSRDGGHAVSIPLHKRFLSVWMALREVVSAKGRYGGVLIISMLLVVFLSIVGRMGTWLGPNGEGLMNAFSVAQHDLGVQPSSSRVDMKGVEQMIEAVSPIRETYQLAMQSVIVEGQEYTANVLDKPEYFHVLEGSVCDSNGILITHTVANELGLTVGDSVQIASGGRRAHYVVSGIYQCANGMGTNIGMTRDGYARIADVNGYIWCYHYILEDGALRDTLMNMLQDNIRGIDVHTNSWSGLSGIVTVMQLLLWIIYVISALSILVAVGMTASKLLRAETGSMAIYKSLGFTSGGLRVSFALRFLLVVSVGSGLGMGLTYAFADRLIARLFRLFGIGTFTSSFSQLGTMLPPLSVALLFYCFAWLTSRSIRYAGLVKLITENDE